MHNQDNWLYNIKGQNESPSPHGTPQIYDNFDASLSDVASFTPTAHVTPPTDYTTEINALQIEVASLRGEFTTLRVDFHKFMDVANEKFNQNFQQIYSIERCFEPNIKSRSDKSHYILSHFRPFHSNNKDTVLFKCGGG